MLQDIANLEDQKLAVGLAIQGVLAYDPKTQAKLKKSNGRRKAGKPAKYHVLAPNGRKYTYQNLPPSIDMSQVCHFTASNDNEAIIKANQLFPEIYHTFMKTVYKHDIIAI